MRAARQFALLSSALASALVASTLLAACADKAKSGAPSTAAPSAAAAADTDDFGVPIPRTPGVGARVISLVPAATEIIFAIGRGNRLVGRTTWDLYPDSARLVPNVGDGIRPNIEVVLAAKPTLVLLYASADNRTAGAAFRNAGIAVVAIRVDRIADFERLSRQLGELLDATDRAKVVVDTVKATLARVRNSVGDAVRPSVMWPLWDAPVLVVGQGSFVAELLDIAGANNIFSDLASPSPEVTIEEIARRNPELVLTSPTGFKRLSMSAKWRSVQAVREGRLRVVDTTLTGRPTVTLGMAAVSLARLLHPERAAHIP